VEALLARGESNITIFDMNDSTLFTEERKQNKVHFIKGNSSSYNYEHSQSLCAAV
jgi:hypothetical protein